MHKYTYIHTYIDVRLLIFRNQKYLISLAMMMILNKKKEKNR